MARPLAINVVVLAGFRLRVDSVVDLVSDNLFFGLDTLFWVRDNRFRDNLLWAHDNGF